MKTVLKYFLLLIIPFNCFAQSQQLNLEKYWKYRKRLRDKFIVVSNINYPGTNIPARDKFPYFKSNEGLLHWGDGNENLSHYISMLATEYRLLKNNNQHLIFRSNRT